MIVVTGSRRSGTSLWMQILEAAGYPIVGDKFPANWQEIIGAANQAGFYESKLVEGINYHTNPDPDSGMWMPPDKVANHGIKILAEGLHKTDYSYIGKVIFTVRNWYECESSQARLNQIKSQHPDFKGFMEHEVALPPGYRWWQANFSVVRDLQTRRHNGAIFSYESLLDHSEDVIKATLNWLGGGNLEAALAMVNRQLRTQAPENCDKPEHDFSQFFDEMYQVLHLNQPLTQALIKRWYEADVLIRREIQQIVQQRK